MRDPTWVWLAWGTLLVLGPRTIRKDLNNKLKAMPNFHKWKPITSIVISASSPFKRKTLNENLSVCRWMAERADIDYVSLSRSFCCIFVPDQLHWPWPFTLRQRRKWCVPWIYRRVLVQKNAVFSGCLLIPLKKSQKLLMIFFIAQKWIKT